MTTAHCDQSLETSRTPTLVGSEEMPSSAAWVAVDATFEHLAAYEKRLDRNPQGLPSYRPYEYNLPEDDGPDEFLADALAVARTYGSKVQTIDMAEVTASEDAAVRVEATLKQVCSRYVNPMLITIDLLPASADTQQLERRDVIRASLSEFVIPSLIIVAPEVISAS